MKVDYCSLLFEKDSTIYQDYQDKINALLRGETKCLHLDLKRTDKSSRIYSIRLNDRDRLLFTTIKDKLSGRPSLLILELIKNHDYQKSRFLKHSVLKQFLQLDSSWVTIAVQDVLGRVIDNEPDMVVTHNPLEHDPLYYNEQYILLDEGQLEAMRNAAAHQFPLLIDGPPGSGKTCVALSLLKQFVVARQTQDTLPILYLCVSPNLLAHVKQQWLECPESRDEGGEPRNWVEFLTYNEWLVRADATARISTLVDQTAFRLWFDQYTSVVKKTTSPDKIYQEFCLIGNKDRADYQALGQRQSFFPQGNDRNDVYNQFQAFKNYLSRNAQLNPAWHAVEEGEALFRKVVVDEAHDLTQVQLQNLAQRTYQQHIAYCIDTHQSLIASHSVRSALYQLFNSTLTHVMLRAVYRCAAVILTLANQVLAIKNVVMDGVNDKLEKAQIDLNGCEKPGYVSWHDHNNINQIVIECRTRFKETDIALIVPEHLLQAVKQETGLTLIFTPKDIKGLQFPCIIAYEPLDFSEFEMVNSALPTVGNELQVREHRSKSNTSDKKTPIPHLNSVFVTFTRATDELRVLQPSKPRLRNLIDRLKQTIPQAPVVVNSSLTNKSVTTNRQDWLDTYKMLQSAGLQKQAEDIYSKHLSIDNADATLVLQESRMGTSTTQTSSSSEQTQKKIKRLKTTSEQTPKKINQTKTTLNSVLPELPCIPAVVTHLALTEYVINALKEKNPGHSLCSPRAANSPSLFELIFTAPKNTLALHLLFVQKPAYAEPFFQAIKPYLLRTMDPINQVSYLDLFVVRFCERRFNGLPVALAIFLEEVSLEQLNRPLNLNHVASVNLPNGSTLLYLLLKHAQILKCDFFVKYLVTHITWEDLNKVLITEGPDQGMNLLYLLLSSIDVMRILMQPQFGSNFSQKISMEGLCSPVTGDGPDQGKSAFYQLCKDSCLYMYQNWEPSDFKIYQEALHRPCTAAGEEKGKTPFYSLCTAELGTQLLSKLWFPLFKSKINSEDLHIPLECTGPDMGATPFFSLSAHPEGQKLLKLDWPFFSNNLTVAELGMQKWGEDEFQGWFPFYFLSGSEDGRELIAAKWDFFKQHINEELLHKKITNECECQHSNPFSHFCAHDKGTDILREHFDFFKPIISQAQLHCCVGEDGRTPFMLLCNTHKGSDLMHKQWDFFSERMIPAHLNTPMLIQEEQASYNRIALDLMSKHKAGQRLVKDHYSFFHKNVSEKEVSEDVSKRHHASIAPE